MNNEDVVLALLSRRAFRKREVRTGRLRNEICTSLNCVTRASAFFYTRQHASTRREQKERFVACVENERVYECAHRDARESASSFCRYSTRWRGKLNEFLRRACTAARRR